MSAERQPVPQKDSSKILRSLDASLDSLKIGSPELRAYSDYSRLIFLQSKLTRQYEENEEENDFKMSNLNNRIIIIEERIEDRKVTIKGYRESNRIADSYLTRLRSYLYHEDSINDSIQECDYHHYAVDQFCTLVEERLDR